MSTSALARLAVRRGLWQQGLWIPSRGLASAVPDVAAKPAGDRVTILNSGGGFLLRYGPHFFTGQALLTGSLFLYLGDLPNMFAGDVVAAVQGVASVLGTVIGFAPILFLRHRKPCTVVQMDVPAEDPNTVALSTLTIYGNTLMTEEVERARLSASHTELSSVDQFGGVANLYCDVSPGQRRLVLSLLAQKHGDLDLRNAMRYLPDEDKRPSPEKWRQMKMQQIRRRNQRAAAEGDARRASRP